MVSFVVVEFQVIFTFSLCLFLVCVYIHIFNKMYCILMVRKSTLKLFSFWKWRDGRFGLVTEPWRAGKVKGEEGGREAGVWSGSWGVWDTGESPGAGGRAGAAEQLGDAIKISLCP